MSTWIAAFIAVAAIGTTYLFCVRPALRGSCGMGGAANAGTDTDRQLAELREELCMMRAEEELSAEQPAQQPDGPAGVEIR